MTRLSRQRLSEDQKFICSQIVTDYQRYVYRCANWYFNNVPHFVDEVFQEVMGIALSKALIKNALPEVGTPAFRCWLRKTTFNACSNVRDFQIRSAGIFTRKRDRRKLRDPQSLEGTDDLVTVNCSTNGNLTDIDYLPSGTITQDEQYERAEDRTQKKDAVLSAVNMLNTREIHIIKSSLNNEEDDEMLGNIPFRQIPQYRQRAINKIKKAVFKPNYCNY